MWRPQAAQYPQAPTRILQPGLTPQPVAANGMYVDGRGDAGMQPQVMLDSYSAPAAYTAPPMYSAPAAATYLTAPASYGQEMSAAGAPQVLQPQPAAVSQTYAATYSAAPQPAQLQQAAHSATPQAGAYQPPDPTPEEGPKETIIVPENAVPGTKLQYTASDGQELRLTVPEGVPPGSIMTLQQDPVTKAWKCMAEPADLPEEPQPQAQQPQRAHQIIGQSGPSMGANERVMTYVTGPPTVTTYSSIGGAAPTVRTAPMPMHMQPMQPMPVNLSYVPPPQPGMVAAMPPGHVMIHPGHPGPGTAPMIFPQMMEQRHSYTPPPVMVLEQRPSYTPPPVGMVENRPSYTPLPQGFAHTAPAPTMTAGTVHAAPPMILQQTPSYVPPPVMQVMPGMTMPTAMAPGPSIMSLPPPGPQPQHGMTWPGHMAGTIPAQMPPGSVAGPPVVHQVTGAPQPMVYHHPAGVPMGMPMVQQPPMGSYMGAPMHGACVHPGMPPPMAVYPGGPPMQPGMPGAHMAGYPPQLQPGMPMQYGAPQPMHPQYMHPQQPPPAAEGARQQSH